ncbi:MAG TPA: hypothetical protein VKT33_15705, partial [Candidatus Angelobacter sp.]|nr:hypothetical protein [Candidatus Angelobacter sp.]
MVAGLIFVLISALAPGFAQTSEPETKSPAKDSIATITYTLDWHDAQPAHYSIKLDSAGHATYESLANASTDPADKFECKFAMSADLRDRIFALA